MADITDDAILLLQAVKETRGRFGLNLPVDVLRGSRNARITQQGFERLPCHGKGSHHPAEHWQAVGRGLVRNKLVQPRSSGPGKGFGKGFRKGGMVVYSVSDLGERLLSGQAVPVRMDMAADAAKVTSQRQQRAKRRAAKRAWQDSSLNRDTDGLTQASQIVTCHSGQAHPELPKATAENSKRRPVATPSRKRGRLSGSQVESALAADSATASASRLPLPMDEHQGAPSAEDGLRPPPNPGEILAPSALPGALDAALMPFQRAGVAFAVRRGGCCLVCDDMGLGKTIQAIAVCCAFRADWPAVIVVPNSVRLVWADELERWIPDLGPGGVNIVQTGQDLAGLQSEVAFFHILTYGLLARENPVRQFLLERGFKVVVVDESHMIKNGDALRTQQVLEVTRRAERVVLLSGTPALARPVELFTQIKAVRPELFPSYKVFTHRYCAPKWTPYGIDVNGASNLQELHSHLQPIMVRRLKSDVLTELPSKRRQRIQIQADAGAVLALANLKDQLKKARDRDPQVKHRLLMQLYVETCHAKIAPVCEYVLDLLQGGCKFLIFGHHMAMLDALEEAVRGRNVKYIRIDGSVKAAERHRQVKEFQADEQVRVAILGLMAAGVGITLTAASTVVFAELHWTPGVLIQAEDRAHRIGQKSSVNIHYLIARETVDDVIWPSVSHKVQVVSTMVDGSKDRLIAGYSSASDAVELAGRQDMDDVVSALEAAPELEPEEAEMRADESSSSATEGGPGSTLVRRPDESSSSTRERQTGSTLARLRARVKSATQIPLCCSFYVSSVTGRVHVLDLEGRPLGQGASFKLSDWEVLWDHGGLPQALLHGSAAARATEVFLCQWFSLKPSEQRDLLNRITTPPLAQRFQKEERAAEQKRYKQLKLNVPVIRQRKEVNPTMCSWCKEAEPENGSLFCSPSCEARGTKAKHSSFGKAFVGHLLAAVARAGPYSATLEGMTLQVTAHADSSKSGDKIPARKCQWNDGWDVRTLVLFDGAEMSFKALKDKVNASLYEEAQRKMAQLKERITSAAAQAVPDAKAAAMEAVSQSPTAQSHLQEATSRSREEAQDQGEGAELVRAAVEVSRPHLEVKSHASSERASKDEAIAQSSGQAFVCESHCLQPTNTSKEADLVDVKQATMQRKRKRFLRGVLQSE